ncbi:MAG: 3-hydroxyacyl-ACP dehydratase FabZ family protein [Fuerstiella sp.]
MSLSGALSLQPTAQATDKSTFRPCTSTDSTSMKFCLVDRITELTPGESISTIKNVSLAEEYLQDHFPGFSVLPGVMMVEAMVQSCAWLSRVTDDFRYSTILLKQARAVKFNNFLKPGQTLEVTATLKKNEDETASFQASGTVEGTSAVSARLVLSKQNLDAGSADMADADARIQQAMKELFGQICPDGLAAGKA